MDVLEALDQPAAVVAVDGRVVAANRGWSDGGFTGSEALDGVLREVLSRGEAGVAHVVDGSGRGVQARVTAVDADHGLVALALGPASTEDGVREEPALLDALMVTLDEGVMLIGPDGTMLASNPAAERILGMSGEAIARRGAADPAWDVVDGRGDRLPPERQPWAESIALAQPVSTLLGVRRGDGRVWLRVNARPVVPPGDTTPSASVVSFHDVTAVREAEDAALVTRQRLVATIENLPQGVVLTGSDGPIVLMNTEFCRMFRLDHVAEGLTSGVRGLQWEDMEPLVGDLSAFQERCVSLMAEGVAVTGEQIPLTDGRVLSRDFIPVLLPDGSREFIWVYADVTDVSRRHDLLSQERDVAERAAQEKSDFLAELGHELRTPLSGMVGAVDLLLAGVQPEQGRELLTDLRSSVDRLNRLLDNMLDLARVEAGRLELMEEVFDLVDLVESVTATFGPSAREAGVALQAWVEPDVPRHQVGDGHRIGQVLLNLLSNAVKFTPAGGVGLHVHRRAGRVHLVVADTGVGMPVDHTRSVFEPFVQAQKPLGRHHGFGLGLAVVRSLVSAMDGSVDVVSVPGAGTTVTVVLPCRPAEGSRGVAGDQSPANRDVPALAGRVVRLVGPPSPASRAVAGVLAGLGLHLLDPGADTDVPEEALVLIGDPTGPDPARIVEGYSRRLPVLLLSTAGEPPLGTQCRALRLPVRTEVLARTLAELLHARDGSRATEGSDAADHPCRHPSRHVLVAEDDDTNRLVLQRLVERTGARCTVVADGRQAVDAALRQHPDVILMDVDMPVLDGRAAARELRARGVRVPILALTAYTTAADRQSTAEAGMDGHLLKPITLTHLTKVLQEAGSAQSRRNPPAAGEAFDPHRLEQLVAELGDREVVAEVVRTYLSELGSRLGAVEASAGRPGSVVERTALMSAAHTLKSSSALVGAKQVAGLCATLEAAAATAAPDSLRGVVERLVGCVPAAQAGLEGWLAGDG
jgi:PAS domain S-box-containing protein